MPRLTFRSKNRRFGRIAIFAISLLVFFPQSAYAETYNVAGAQDFFFEISAPQQFTARTYAQQYGIDSHLWVYNSQNELLAANDDYFGLDSYIQIELLAGTYRVRAGVCCGDPTRWYGNSYTLDMNSQAINAPTTTVESTTTTVEPTTTTEEPTTTTETPTTTTEALTTTTVAETTTTQESTTLPEVPTTMQQSTTILVLETTSTTSTTVPPTTTTQLYIPLPIVPTMTTVASTTTSTTPRTTLPEPSTSIASSTSTITEIPTTIPSTTTTITETPIVAELITNLNDKSTEEIKSAVQDIIANGVTSDDAVMLSTSSEVLQAVSTEEAKEIFAAIDTGALSLEQTTQLVEAVQNAPESVRNEFESQINVFDNKFGKYVPVGSNVSVSKRKVIIAATGMIFMAPTISLPPSAPTAPSPSGGGTGGDDTSGSSESRKRQSGKRK